MDSLVAGRSGIGLHQKRKFIELRNQYTLTGDDGQEIGKVEQAKQSPLAFILRVVSSMDVALPVTLHVTTSDNREALKLHKPWFRFAVKVSDDAGSELGTVKKKMRVGKAVFSIEGSGGDEVGVLKAENWRARDFRYENTSGTELARVTKQWRGLLTEAFTDADSYAVTFEGSADNTTRKLALAAALAVDLTMKQKDTN
ncbi:MAG TPA: phospholipid scramblase-related protein [Acidimicrobiales bacterium]|nr:phospholipid scramblase-related protein [Acidimicrobiales bacterium]